MVWEGKGGSRSMFHKSSPMIDAKYAKTISDDLPGREYGIWPQGPSFLRKQESRRPNSRRGPTSETGSPNRPYKGGLKRWQFLLMGMAGGGQKELNVEFRASVKRLR